MPDLELTDSGENTPAPLPDPSNSPPSAWLTESPYGAEEPDPPPLMGLMTLASSSCQCVPAPALEIERHRLAAIGGSWLGCCGDANHNYGFHIPACRLPSSDYSMRGPENQPVNPAYACAGDFGMGWPASRTWLRWLIREIREGRLTGIAEVIGSYDGRNVRYWSTSSGWSENGIAYTGQGHDTWSHVSVTRSTADRDHGILAGWTATTGPDTSTPQPPRPTPQPTDDWSSILMPVPEISRGATGAYVRRAQGLAVAAGQNVGVDGDFGPRTEQAIRAVQSRNGIGVDGVCGPNTWRALLTGA